MTVVRIRLELWRVCNLDLFRLHHISLCILCVCARITQWRVTVGNLSYSDIGVMIFLWSDTSIVAIFRIFTFGHWVILTIFKYVIRLYSSLLKLVHHRCFLIRKSFMLLWLTTQLVRMTLTEYVLFLLSMFFFNSLDIVINTLYYLSHLILSFGILIYLRCVFVGVLSLFNIHINHLTLLFITILESFILTKFKLITLWFLFR